FIWLTSQIKMKVFLLTDVFFCFCFFYLSGFLRTQMYNKNFKKKKVLWSFPLKHIVSHFYLFTVQPITCTSHPKISSSPTYFHLSAVSRHTDQSYADPVAGAPAPFMRRISELSSLEADTVRQEKRKTRRPREPPP
uniref:Uncharacterized protein n=1 Tax=Mola mola TaxID=94237 RepID=A0A3Q3VT26_MOLML